MAMTVDLDKLKKAVSAASANRQASGAAPKAIDKFVNPSYGMSAGQASSNNTPSYSTPSYTNPTPNTGGISGGMSAGAASTPKSGPKTVYLESGGYVNLDANGQIVGHGGQLNPNQMSQFGQNGTTGDFNSNLDKEYAAGKIKNTFDFIPGQGTQWNTGTTNWSPFAVDLKTAAANAGQSSGMSAQAAGATQQSTPQGSFPSGTGFTNFNPSSTDYAAQAAARTAAALAQKQTIANQQKASADSAFEKQRLRTNDDRTLQDFSRKETVNPFSGRTSFENGLIGRERTQADADASAALAAQKGNIDALLADYQNATAEEQVRIADELERADRDYQMQLAQFNRGNFESDRNFNQQSEQAQDAQAQQDWENRFNYGQAIGQFGNGQQTVQKIQQDWDNAFQQGQFDFQKAQQVWDNAFKDKSFQQSMEEAAASRGLQWANLSQRDKEFVADQAFREKQFKYQQEQDALSNSGQSNLSSQTYTDFLTNDLPRLQSAQEGKQLIDLARQKGVSEEILQKMAQEINRQFSE